MPFEDGSDIVKSLHDSRVADRMYLRLESGDSIQISPDIALRYDLHQGRELSVEELEILRQDASRDGAKARALRVLSARPMSKAELTDRLRKKGESLQDAENAVELMERVGFIDDEEYAHQVVRWCAGKGYGYHRAVSELGRRKVPREYWEAALEQLPQPDDTLDRLVERRLKPGADRNDIRKLTDALLRRGFDRDDIRSAINRHTDQYEDQEDYQ